MDSSTHLLSILGKVAGHLSPDEARAAAGELREHATNLEHDPAARRIWLTAADGLEQLAETGNPEVS